MSEAIFAAKNFRCSPAAFSFSSSSLSVFARFFSSCVLGCLGLLLGPFLFWFWVSVVSQGTSSSAISASGAGVL
ncbi:hypothetical protein AOQ84DRAFT_354041 [Glonium stellatum]|uniref:Uncharacterized protein n=1 Tax=Glonium stellatum TaxID=574774 RepID=A0A8E2JU41_9PEZI|nr:hypothetical protein AOQ84DRAFT_354041 [Glonium stellatum]